MAEKFQWRTIPKPAVNDLVETRRRQYGGTVIRWFRRPDTLYETFRCVQRGRHQLWYVLMKGKTC